VGAKLAWFKIHFINLFRQAQYFDMVTIINQFIESERSGNWDLQLQTIYMILPYFLAIGHYSYAKCCHLYLQDINNSKKKNLRMNFRNSQLMGVSPFVVLTNSGQGHGVISP
jgi:hypothetical protein